MNNESYSGVAIIGIVLLFIVGIISLLILNPLVQIGAGERGIVLTWGAYTGNVLEPGLHWRAPISQKVIQMDVQTQKEQVDVSAASKDLQNVSSTVALNFHLDPEKVGDLYRNIGLSYKERIIDPAIQEAMKSVTARYTAEELITHRQNVKDEAKVVLSERLNLDFIFVDDLSIVNFNFSESFNNAIEAKVTAEQTALAAKNKLEQVKFEAQQQIETAKASAESIRIQAEALQKNQDLVKLKAVEKWNGVLPQYLLQSAMPFLDVK